jgi:hypothetical protein
MEDDIKTYKRKINSDLAPIKDMLVHKQSTVDKNEWLNFVEQTRISIINHPAQYLGPELPDRKMLPAIITGIFEEFINDHSE